MLLVSIPGVLLIPVGNALWGTAGAIGLVIAYWTFVQLVFASVGSVLVAALYEIATTGRRPQGFDGYIFGCPTYHRDMTENFKTFLFLAQKGNIAGRLGGAFGSSTHSGEAPGYIFDTMEHVYKMEMTNLGPFGLREVQVGTTEGMRACQDYGRAIGKKLAGS